MVVARKRKEDQSLSLALGLEEWATKHGVEADTYLQGLLVALREKRNLPLWAELNPLDYLPHAELKMSGSLSAWMRRLSILRGVMLFAPVALTWFAVGQASDGFSRYIDENPAAIVNFLEFWQNGYGYIAEEWTLTRIAFLDFLIISLVILLTVVVASLSRRIQQSREEEAATLDRERFEIGLALSEYLFEKRSVTPITMKDSLARSLQDLSSSTKALLETAKSLEKSAKNMPSNTEILKEVKKLKPSFSFDWDK